MSSDKKHAIGIDEIYRPASDFIELKKACDLVEKERDELRNENNNLKQVISSIILNQGLEFFVYDVDTGFDICETMQGAIDIANDMIAVCRGESYDGWPVETDNICWGVVVQRATANKQITDYKLKGIDTLPVMPIILSLCGPQTGRDGKGNG
ncbi:hypothetical protein [Serratia sp. MF2]|uniref:hypothetical protein n=1 Tax=Serratia sp. MF2 TaxID=3059173 RepID=UPI0027EA3E22|nr:hypothetical protein [Serratia sp. MF2]MDQ7101912.1 hypothetical protein [Serratia sp. MF2]